MIRDGKKVKVDVVAVFNWGWPGGFLCGRELFVQFAVCVLLGGLSVYGLLLSLLVLRVGCGI